VRTYAYPSWQAAVADAQALARSMTLKCAIAGLDAGGAKTVVLDHPGLDRREAFARLGGFIEDLGGRYLTAGDVGTTGEDLRNMARGTRHVVTDHHGIAEATAQTVVNGMRACATLKNRSLSGLRVAVQGCGGIGAAVARLLGGLGADLTLADPAPGKAEALAEELGAKVVDPRGVLALDADIVAPCALGGSIDAATVTGLRAWAICGGANNQLADDGAEDLLRARGVLYVPDFLASSGGVISGVSRQLGGTDARA
jgi:leucine dehydrogenase